MSGSPAAANARAAYEKERRRLTHAAQALLDLRAVYERQRAQGQHTAMGWNVRAAKRAWRNACAGLTEEQVGDILRDPQSFLPEVSA